VSTKGLLTNCIPTGGKMCMQNAVVAMGEFWKVLRHYWMC